MIIEVGIFSPDTYLLLRLINCLDFSLIFEDKRGADVLQKVKIQVFDNSECHKAYFPKFKISIRQWHLCAGTKEGGRGTCHVSGKFFA